MMAERLQKVMARAGLGSRRTCENIIRGGRVTVNGELVELGHRVDPEQDIILVDGKRLEAPEPLVYVLLNKPQGVVSSLRAQGDRETVRNLVDLPQRLYPVGRLDLQSEGLILLTNDGELAHQLTHPRYGHEKEYRVMFDKPPSRDQLDTIRRGVVLPEGVRTKPAKVWFEATGEEKWVRIVLKEGRKRQIREVARVLGLHVRRIIRVRFGTIELGELKPREWRKLTRAEVAQLRSGMEKSGNAAR
jgi:23S rRNA pseudouridine2605 synthase